MKNITGLRAGSLILVVLAHGCAYGIVGPGADPSEDAAAVAEPETAPPITSDDPGGKSPATAVVHADAAVGVDHQHSEDRPVPISDVVLALPDVSALDIATTVAFPDAGAPDDVSWAAHNRPADVPEVIDVVPVCPPVRWLDVELDAPTNMECVGGWQVVVWGPTGEEVPSLPPAGERLHLMVPWSWLGVLRFGARCAIVVPARWRDWSPWLGQTVRAAGVRRVTLTALDGVDRDLTDRSMVCAPLAVRELHPDWPLSYYAVGEVALEPSLEGRCHAR